MWTKLLEDSVNFNILLKVLPTKGKLVYEYNPFRNYRLSLLCFEYNLQTYNLGELYKKFKIYPNCKCTSELDENTGITTYKIDDPNSSDNEITKILETLYETTRFQDIINFEEALHSAKISSWCGTSENSDPILREAGELVDFNTNELQINLEHPVLLLPLYSYDGSVNLIINDGINIPRLINSRFSATGNNTYEIIDRKGNNDTNIYDLGELFNSDTSLVKHFLKIALVDLHNVCMGGNLKIGNYHFYFRLSDVDGNETDFIAESGQVNLFIGDGLYSSVTTGQINENCYKLVLFVLSNLDSSYDYLVVYYSRSTSEDNYNPTTEYYKIDKKFIITNFNKYILTITGFEDTIPVTILDINPMYYDLGSAKAMTTCQNMLFFGNVGSENIPYKELSDLSLHFLPCLKEENYDCQYDKNYHFTTTNKGYIDPKFIYNKTGYWGNEIYRFGIVYILQNGKLSPVFNIRGGNNITDENSFSSRDLYDSEGNRLYIDYNESTNYIINGKDLENVKGVVSYNPNKDNNTIYSIDVKVKEEVLKELKKYVKGYFFVRQERIPLTLALAITMSVDKNSGLLTLPTLGGIISNISDTLASNTHVETSTPTGINFISEGFMSRYKFDVEPDHKESWKKAAKWIGVGIVAAACVAACVVTCGAALAPIAAGASAAAGAAAGTAVGAALAAAITTAGSATAMAAAGITAVTATATLGTLAGIVGTTTLVGLGVGLAGSINAWTNGNDIKLDGRNTVIEKGMKKVETKDSRQLDGSFNDRIIITDYRYNEIRALLCPDFVVNQPKYNQIFTGDNFIIETSKAQPITGQENLPRYFLNDNRHFYVDQYQDFEYTIKESVKIVTVPEGVKAVTLEDFTYRSKAGEAEEAFRYEQLGNKQTDTEFKKVNTDIVRGIYCPYLAMSKSNLSPATIVNIKIPNYTESYHNYYLIRMQDNSPFKSISKRIDINNLEEYSSKTNLQNDGAAITYSFNLYQGDCYICLFTQRIIRNFNDPSTPYNDEIIDTNTWKDNYDPDNSEKFSKINLGDVNAVPLGMWVTYRLRSSSNLNIRTLDGSNIDEVIASGHERGYYPYYPMSIDGSYKISESNIYNRGFNKKLSERINILLPDVPYIKNWFGTRIVYSDVHITDAFKNGFRTFLGTHYRDYTREYGSITKLITIGSNILVIFEHGIALIPVNERTLVSESSGGNVYINSSNILPENLKIITDMYGSQWAESILKVPGKNGVSTLWVYGVDTIAKKIWRTDGNIFECISDGKVQSFLNNNITLGERELTPKIGIRNVKTVYNAYKQDVLFTFYDNTYGFEEKVWNLCWNELNNTFITFYSWIPSYMENINNIPFSFNRDTSKWIAKLGISHTENSFADGITLSNNIIDIKTTYDDNTEVYTYDSVIDTYKFPFTYINKLGKEVTTYYEVAEQDRDRLVGVLSLNNRILPDTSMFYQINYSLERDNYLNYKDFEIVPISIIDDNEENKSEEVYYKDKKYNIKRIQLPGNNNVEKAALFEGQHIVVYGLKLIENTDITSLLSEIYYRNKEGNSYADLDSNKIGYEELFVFDNEGKPIKYRKFGAISNMPVYKNLAGKRINLPRNKQLNPDKIVRLLNIKATINIVDPNTEQSLSDTYYNQKAGFEEGTSLINAGYYESTIAVIPKWNLQFLSTDFWKHGQAGIIDITDNIYPTYWYGKQHPFEFECIVVDNPSVHKIFTNLELIANKTKPESFHYEIIGDTYDFAEDKPTMYFRQEALKALYQYNGYDIEYNRNFLDVEPKQHNKSAEFPKYYSRWDTINDIYDSYKRFVAPNGFNYDHLSGAEIVYYPNRDEFRVWNHVKAIDADAKILNKEGMLVETSVIKANCSYLEDKWLVSINPIIVSYKNEFNKTDASRDGKSMFYQDDSGYVYSTWVSRYGSDTQHQLPPINIQGTKLEEKLNNSIEFPDPDNNVGKNNALYGLYNLEFWKQGNWRPIDPTPLRERRETDVRGKFMKVRIRYSGEELAIIDFLNTIYQISFA